MKPVSRFFSGVPSWRKLLSVLILGPIVSAAADLPNTSLPIGAADLPEVRTIKELRPGLTHIHINRGGVRANTVSSSTQRSLSVHIIKLNPKVYRGKVISSWAEAGWLTSPLELAHRDNAVVAANASFYEFSEDDIPGITSGLSIVQGVWHHEHDGWPTEGGHPFLAIENTDEGPKLSIEYELPPRPYIKWGNKRIEIDGFDRAPKQGQSEIVVMRVSLLHKSDLSHGTAQKKYTVVSIDEKFSGKIYNILASGKKKKVIQEAVDSGVPLELDLSVPGRPGLNAFFALYAMIINGEYPEVNDIAGDPRTAVGSDPEGNIYLVSVGPEKESSTGVTLRELQDIGRFLGLNNLYNLDGGIGSTSLVIEKKTVGTPEIPFYKEDRRVADSILIIDSD